MPPRALESLSAIRRVVCPQFAARWQRAAAAR
jgi:hypothetical protein